MNPFGLQLRFYRKERGIPLKVFAEKLHLSEKTLSAIETGRRRPLGGDALRIVSECLGLNERESAALSEAAFDSVSYIRIPQQATPREYRLVHRLVRALGVLSGDQISLIHGALGLKPEEIGTAERGIRNTCEGVKM